MDVKITCRKDLHRCDKGTAETIKKTKALLRCEEIKKYKFKRKIL